MHWYICSYAYPVAFLRNKKMVCCCLHPSAIIALTIIFATYLTPAYAHITKQFGNISVEVGWTEEPPLAGQLNSATVVVEKMVTGGNSTPVSNALSQLDIKEKYGGITKLIEFVPSEQT